MYRNIFVKIHLIELEIKFKIVNERRQDLLAQLKENVSPLDGDTNLITLDRLIRRSIG